MARDRQRAKQRQAARREARLSARRAGREPASGDGELDEVDPELEADAIEAGALAGEGEVFEDELEPARAVRGPRGVRGDEAAVPARRGGGKVLGFLRACWAELQRVQWPDRRTLTQLTGIVVFFVVVAGAYLGVLDQIFSKLIQAIL